MRCYLVIQPGTEGTHSAVHAEAVHRESKDEILELWARFLEVGVPAEPYLSEEDEWCTCAPCNRLSLMASLRLAQYEGRSEVVALCYEKLLSIPVSPQTQSIMSKIIVATR